MIESLTSFFYLFPIAETSVTDTARTAGGSRGSAGAGGGSSGGSSGGGGGGSRKSRPTPTKVFTPSPKSIIKTNPTIRYSPVTVNTQSPVNTQQTTRPNPKSSVGNNPQVKTQNRFPKISTPDPRPKTPIVKLPPPIKIPMTRFPENPRAINPSVQQNISGDASYFTGYALPKSVGTLRPEIVKEFDEHQTGVTLIDPQRLRAIEEGRIVIKTSFETTPQQLKVLQAMEAQKIREKTLTTEQQNQYYLDQKPNNMTMTFQGQDVTEKSLATIEQQRKTAQEQKQIQQEYQNRTDEDKLNNAIQKLLDREKYDPQSCSNCNLTAYLAERGFDVNKPETIPSEAITVGYGKLDTAQKMRQAGLAENIIQVRLQSEKTTLNPNNTITNVMTDTQTPSTTAVTWNLPSSMERGVINLARLNETEDTIFFTPPEQEMVNTAETRDRPITWTSVDTPQPTLIQEALSIPTTIVDPIPTSNLSSLALLATAFLIM